MINQVTVEASADETSWGLLFEVGKEYVWNGNIPPHIKPTSALYVDVMGETGYHTSGKFVENAPPVIYKPAARRGGDLSLEQEGSSVFPWNTKFVRFTVYTSFAQHHCKSCTCSGPVAEPLVFRIDHMVEDLKKLDSGVRMVSMDVNKHDIKDFSIGNPTDEGFSLYFSYTGRWR